MNRGASPRRSDARCEAWERISAPPFPLRAGLLFDMIDAVLCELEGVVVETAVARRRAMKRAFYERVSYPVLHHGADPHTTDCPTS